MWSYNHTPDPDELMHYGVRGMKWKKRSRASKALDQAGLAIYRGFGSGAPSKAYRKAVANAAKDAVKNPKGRRLKSRMMLKGAEEGSLTGWKAAKTKAKAKSALKKYRKKKK